MLTSKWLGLIALMIAMSLGLAACGDDNSGDPPGDLPATTLSLADCTKAGASLNLTARATGPTATPSASNGVRVEVPPGFRLFLSSSQPYAMAVPPEWDIKEHQSQGNIKDADLYIIKKNSNSGAFLTVISDKLKDTSQDSKAFFDSQYKEAQASQKVKFDQQPSRQVAGTDGYVIAYNSPGGQGLTYPTQTVQVLFAAQGRGWVVTFTASPNQALQYCPYVSRALDTWAFTGLIK